MKSRPDRNNESNSSTGLSVIFSEQALLALLHVILVLGIVHLKSNNPASQELPARQEPPAKVLRGNYN
jgi:hypothetical protein